MKLLLQQIIQLAEQAGEAILDVYQRDRSAQGIQAKQDDSPLTDADLAAQQVISQRLAQLTPDIPVLSEEAAATPWPERQHWQRFWLVDPLDGTKEFIKRNGEFTVNIALIEQGKPVLGVVHAPVLQKTWAALKGEGALVQYQGEQYSIHVSQPRPDEPIRVVGSRSHPSPDLADYLKQFASFEMVPVGSSLKFCLVAEGSAHVYPRFGPTMLWDTGAGHIVAEEAGASVQFEGLGDAPYQREQLLNPNFLVSAL
ncbi:3'(2'),5'-bisphosphate nucleotidase CysQ [Alkalimonas sp.]|uniref:3'(2'),5'-bisphosphate nucleotidase CysQ n=1 Tax=Alkalimonas sp. TaxID=1872453 RepID=UPI00263BC802|nr:3'(2'),5'-bisphosphate nucleotidase CysQ [Alkalimonas sp.]MCC5825658.1 3'(2'),5'-bisphosphate nucleotidase CysQ [Alkalimonas sp.]